MRSTRKRASPRMEHVELGMFGGQLRGRSAVCRLQELGIGCLFAEVDLGGLEVESFGTSHGAFGSYLEDASCSACGEEIDS